MSLCCFECYDVYKTCKRFCKSFWVIGGSKLGFWKKKGFENRRFWSVQMMLRLSELPRSCPELEFDRSLKRKPSER